MRRVKAALIAFQRPEKSESPGSNVRMAKMIWQDHDRINSEWLPIPRMTERGAQQSNMIDEQR